MVGSQTERCLSARRATLRLCCTKFVGAAFLGSGCREGESPATNCERLGDGHPQDDDTGTGDDDERTCQPDCLSACLPARKPASQPACLHAWSHFTLPLVVREQ